MSEKVSFTEFVTIVKTKGAVYADNFGPERIVSNTEIGNSIPLPILVGRYDSFSVDGDAFVFTLIEAVLAHNNQKRSVPGRHVRISVRNATSFQKADGMVGVIFTQGLLVSSIIFCDEDCLFIKEQLAPYLENT